MLETIHFEKFTAFEDLRIDFSPGINIFIGENGTGKTHILKAAYAACDIAKSKDGFFWDEPETNLNPRLMQAVIGILLDLARLGVQIFITTHDYVVLKEFDLQSEAEDSIQYHSLFRDEETGEIQVASTGEYLEISPNAIDETFGGFVDREVAQSMGGLGK